MLSLNNQSALLKKRKRIGRGGCRGGTSGRGHKGQNARSGGGVPVFFEGGQMPLTRRMPKRGFSNIRFADEWVIINLDALNKAFDDGSVINKDLLSAKGLIKSGQKTLLKILGQGVLEKRLVVTADAFSASAREAIIKCGGEVQIIKEM